MTTDTTQTDPFDTELYDELMTGYPTNDAEIEGLDNHDMHYTIGRKAAAMDAARIVAERASTAPSDAELLKAIAKARKTLDFIRADELKIGDVVHAETTLRTCPADMNRIGWTLDKIEEALTNRAALQPAPLVDLREKLLDPELAYDISSELFMHGFEDDDSAPKRGPAIAIGAVIGHLFGECRICATGEVQARIKQDLAEWNALQEAEVKS